jgi:hypothetical protein
MLLTGNPLYPQGFWIFQGEPHWDLMNVHIANIVLSDPFGMFNAVFSEYTIWSLALLLPVVIVCLLRRKKDTQQRHTILHLVLLGYLNLSFFLFLPTLPHFNNMVSSFRYSYSVFIPLILSLFLAAKLFHQEDVLCISALASLIIFPSFPYHPKILFILLPLLFLVFSAQTLKHYAVKYFRHVKR